MRVTYRFEIAYDGAGFRGFRRSAGERTVESVLLEAIAPLLPEVSSLAVAGQTDAGVHALGQVVSCYGHAVDLAMLAAALRCAAPGEIALLRASTMPRSFHARSSAIRRSYRYCLPAAAIAVDRLAAMVAALASAPSLAAFARDTDDAGRPLEHASLTHHGPNLWLDFSAAKFVRRQVRVMVATALAAAAHSDPPESLHHLDRAATEPPAPADGLALMRIDYAAPSGPRLEIDDPLPPSLLRFVPWRVALVSEASAATDSQP